MNDNYDVADIFDSETFAQLKLDYESHIERLMTKLVREQKLRLEAQDKLRDIMVSYY